MPFIDRTPWLPNRLVTLWVPLKAGERELTAEDYAIAERYANRAIMRAKATASHTKPNRDV